ncbi:MAG TPA: phosphoribosylaminoimidazolesuccinocarboxamide synthase [Candidatus Syntrophosphaera sp.]|nr:phosphoribosylaminoimidazolesuccinocarboxamide synthase [Candidatus Syntrophosphaera sp.]
MYEEISKLSIVKGSQQGKVRDIFDLGDTLLIVTTDRISAFDVILPDPLPGKGAILNQIAAHIFRTTRHIVPNHFLTDRIEDYPAEFQPFQEYLSGRSMLVKKCRVIPIECIVRGYISGSAWSEYQRTGTVGGMLIPEEMKESQKFPKPLFTPSTKATKGHDENISYREMQNFMDRYIAEFLRDKSLELYNHAHAKLLAKGIVLADTKFEFGVLGNEIILVDEALTPDSSRFWELSEYAVGKSPKSYDKQIVRDYLSSLGWNKRPPAPYLPDEIKQQALEKYREIKDIIIGACN